MLADEPRRVHAWFIEGATMTETTEASIGTLAFMLLTCLLVFALIWLGHLRYMLG